MLLPSLYRSGDRARDWSLVHAALYGAVIGTLAALFKTLGPPRAGAVGALAAHVAEIAGAALAFALLCAAAAALRNFIVRRLV